MSISNIKLLTKEERQFFKDNYIFEIKADVLLVKSKTYGRVIAHSINEDFSLSTKLRKIKISKEAIKLWSEKFINTNYNVVDIQNAINSLIIGYQDSSYEDVKNQLIFIESKDNV